MGNVRFPSCVSQIECALLETGTVFMRGRRSKCGPIVLKAPLCFLSLGLCFLRIILKQPGKQATHLLSSQSSHFLLRKPLCLRESRAFAETSCQPRLMHKRYYNWLREVSISAPMCVAESGASDAPSQHRGTVRQFWLEFSSRPITVRLFMSLRSHSLPPLSRAKQCTCGINKENMQLWNWLILKMEENNYGNPKVWDHERQDFSNFNTHFFVANYIVSVTVWEKCKWKCVFCWQQFLSCRNRS